MSQVQVVMATMNQKDFSIVKKLNIRCDAVIANQASRESVWEMNTADQKVKIVTTDTRGVGRNRNIGLENATGEILLFADDDLVYNDDMAEKVTAAFDELADADVIVFGISLAKNGKIFERKVPQTGKLPFLKSMKYGMVHFAVRAEKLKSAGIKISELFGGGCLYCHGEDSDFLMQCFKAGMKIYTYNYELGVTSCDESTWFCGFNDKYFYDTGALAKNTFGLIAVPFMVRAAARTEGEGNMSYFKKIRLLFIGYKNFKKLVSYDEWKKK